MLLSIYLFTSLFSCSKEVTYEWIRIQNEDLYIWDKSDNQNLVYHWDGESFDKLVHGAGTLSVYDNDSLIAQKTITAYYGTISNEDILTLSDGSSYIGKIQNDLFEGFGVYLKGTDIYIGSFVGSKPNDVLNWYKNGALYYSGEWLNGNFHGKGRLYKEDGSIKQGTWQEGKLLQTYTKQQTSEGFYEGYILNSQPDGRGLMLYNDSSRYDGEWSAGKWTGEGEFYTKTDSVIGEWQDGKLNGSAVYKTNNFVYNGDWVDNKPDGFGYIMVSDSSYYSGEWSEGKRNGYGDMYFANSDSYFGDWSDNQFDGLGGYTFAQNGDYYYGEWKNGLQHGLGTYTAKDYEYVGNWEEGWINGKGRITYANKDVYEGDFVENELYGIGHYQFSNGNSYEGEFVDGKFNGLGRFLFADGSVYEGEFQDGKIKGDGTLYYKEEGDTIAITANWDGTNNFPKQASVLFGNGDLYEGELVNGFPTGNGTWTTEKERENSDVKIESSIARANDFYKKHRDTWNKFVNYTSVVLTVVEYAAPIAGTVAIATGVGAPIGAALITAGKVAGVANIALNTADAAIATASSSIDVYEAVQKGEDATKVLTTLGTELAVNAAFIVVPKALKSVPARKATVGLSGVARSAARKSTIVLSKNKVFGKCVSVIKSKAGQLEKAFSTSRLNRLYGRSNSRTKQAVWYNFEQFKKKYPNHVSNVGEAPNGTILGNNMLSVGGKKMRKAVANEKIISRRSSPNQSRVVCEAHHIVAGKSQAAKKAREILECCGIGINDARNGIWLPTSQKSTFRGWIHGRHKKSYDERVLELLINMKKNHGCSEKHCMEVLNDIKRKLIKGDKDFQLINKPNNTIINALYQ